MSLAMSAILAQYRAAARSLNRLLRHPRHQAFILAVLIVVCSGVIFYSLTEEWSLADSLYFTVIALTTIGFGDLAPTTTFSRLFTVLYATVGVGLIGTLLSLIYHNAKQAYEQQGPGPGAPEN